MPAGRATSTVLGTPGWVTTRTGLTCRRGELAAPAATFHHETNRVASVVVEMTVRRTRGEPTTVTARGTGAVSKATLWPGSAASR